MSAISGYISTIQNAVYGEQVRAAIVNALLACYSDVENPDLQSAAFQTAIENAYEDGILDIITVTSFNDMTNQNIIYRYNGTAAGKQKGLYYYSALSNSWVLIGSEIQKVSLLSQMTDVNDIYKYIGTESGMVQNSLYCHNGTSWVPIGSGVLTASTAAQMTNTDAIYKYTGNETGYVTNGLYYYNGTSWTPVSPKVETDKTLTEENEPADAKATGDKIAEINNLLEGTEKSVSVDFIFPDFIIVAKENPTSANMTFGEPYPLTGWFSSDYVDCGGCSSASITLEQLQSGAVAGIVFYDSDKTAISGYIPIGSDGLQLEDIQIPFGSNYFRVCVKTEDIENFSATLTESIASKAYEVAADTAELSEEVGLIMDSVKSSELEYIEPINVTFAKRCGLWSNTTDQHFGENYPAATDWSVSGYVDCSGLESIYITLQMGAHGGAFGLVFYDDEYSPLSSVLGGLGSGLSPTEVEIPTNANYFRVSIRTENLSGFFAKKLSEGIVDLTAVESFMTFANKELETVADYLSHVTVNVSDFDNENLTDSEIIEQAIEFASIFETRTLVFDRDFLIDRSILVPSNTEIIIDGCTIKQADETFDTAFRGNNLTFSNEHPYGYATSYTNIENIKIIGKNGAVISGPDVNATINGNTAVGDPYGWRGFMINFAFARNVEIADISFVKQRSWCISFEKSSYVNCHDLVFTSTVPNGDGINFRAGCHHCTATNLSGSTSDDTVACSAFKYGNTPPNSDANYPHSYYLYPLEPSQIFNDDLPVRSLDIHDIKIENITTGGSTPAVICLAADGLQVYNILIDSVIESTHRSADATVKLFTGFSANNAYNAGDIHDIRINNICTKDPSYVVMCTVQVSNVWMNKLYRLSGSTENITSITYPTGITITNSGA